MTLEVIRWAGLVLGLLLTLVVLKEVALVLRTLSDIRRLAEAIREASRGIARHVEPAKDAGRLASPAGRFRGAGRRFSRAASSMAERLSDAPSDR